MARLLSRRIHIEGMLETTAPMSVGGAGGDVDVDLALARNGEGALYLPGTGITGPLRSWVGSVLRKAAATTLFGWMPRKGNEGGHASYWVSEDAVIDGAEPPIDIRDSVSLDRRQGRSASRFKFTRAVLPQGTRFKFSAHVDVPVDKADETLIEETLAHLITAMEKGEIGYGAARTRGLGDTKLVSRNLWYEDWSCAQGVIDVLSGKKATYTLRPVRAYQPTQVDVEIEWTSDGPLMVKAPYDTLTVDMLPMTAHLGRGATTLAAVLPGSGIKGALRSHAERIIRTVAGRTASDNFADQLALPIAAKLFGAARPKGQDTALGGRGLLTAYDCYGETPFCTTIWQQVLQQTDTSSLSNELRSQANTLGRWDVAFHVPVDRWTAAPAHLFNAIEPTIAWEPIKLRFMPRKGADADSLPMLALLCLVLQDFKDGKIPLGFGVNRGYGSVRVNEIKLNVQGRMACDLGLPDGTISLEKLLANETAASRLGQAWSKRLGERDLAPKVMA